MRARVGLPFVISAGLSIATLVAQQPVIRDRRLFRSGIELTSITATVRDGQGRLVSGLEREAFEVFEDGDPQTITQFTNERVPISLGVLLDTSDSMFGRRIKDARAAVERFLFDLLDPGDEYFVMSFNHQPHALTRWTSAPDVMRRALDRLKPIGGTAALDAIVASLPMFANRSRERAALLIISDGADTASDATIARRALGARPQRRVRLRHRDRLAGAAGRSTRASTRPRCARSPTTAAAGPKSSRAARIWPTPPRGSPRS